MIWMSNFKPWLPPLRTVKVKVKVCWRRVLQNYSLLYLYILYYPSCLSFTHHYMNYVVLLMLPSDVFFAWGSKRHAGLLGVCFPWYRFLVFCILRNILDKRGQRSRRCAWRGHSHHQRWRQPCTRRRKERILHLDCRGSCAALHPLSISVSLFRSLSPPSLLHLCPLPPSTRNPLAVHRQRRSRSVFLLLPFVEPICIISILSFISSQFLYFLPVFTGSLPLLLRLSPFSYFPSSLIWMPGSLHIYHDCILHGPQFVLSPSKQTPKHKLYPLSSHTSTNTLHISHQHGA